MDRDIESNAAGKGQLVEAAAEGRLLEVKEEIEDDGAWRPLSHSTTIHGLHASPIRKNVHTAPIHCFAFPWNNSLPAPG